MEAEDVDDVTATPGLVQLRGMRRTFYLKITK